MTEQESSQAEADLAPMGSGLSETFETRPIGEYLRRQRVLRGMTAEELAAITRIPLRSLERLESGQFDGETDGFVRGFVRTVANALGLDADDAISRMLQEPLPSAWEQHAVSRSAKQASIAVILCLSMVAAFYLLRAGWYVLLGEASTANSREVVLWHDPVRALAEATGAQLDPSTEMDPMRREAAESSTGFSQLAGEERRGR